MLTLGDLAEKIKHLENEKAKLLEDEKFLRGEAQGKIVLLECEVATLREDVESLKKMLA